MIGGGGEDAAAMQCVGGLLGEPEESGKRSLHFNEADIAIIAALHSDIPLDVSALPPVARRLYALSGDATSANAIRAAGSPGAFYAIVRAWMSELPLKAEIVRFGRKALAAADRQAANRAATDRGDPDVLAVEAAAYKVWHEFDRLRGLLRFAPDADGAYIARCEPDHFVLPALGPHFSERFGETPWAIIDEKRRLCLRCDSGHELELFNCLRGTHTPPPQAKLESHLKQCPGGAGGQRGACENFWDSPPEETREKNQKPGAELMLPGTQDVETPHNPETSDNPIQETKPGRGSAGGIPQVFASPAPPPRPAGEWEDLWRLYHKTINNESRNNPDLQKQFMPKRYWKYLTEM